MSGALIGYDTSDDMSDLSVVCVRCAKVHGTDGGSALHDGDEWAVHMDEHCCRHCRRDLSADGLVLVAEV